MRISTHLNTHMQTRTSMRNPSTWDSCDCDSRGRLAHVLHAEEGVIGIGGAQDAWGEDDGEGAWRHLVVIFLIGYPGTKHTICTHAWCRNLWLSDLVGLHVYATGLGQRLHKFSVEKKRSKAQKSALASLWHKADQHVSDIFWRFER